MKRTIAASVGEVTLASSSDQSATGPVRTGPSTAMPAFRSASRNAVAAASAGVRVTTRPTRARATTGAEKRRRLVDEEARLPAGDDAPRVVRALVAGHSAGHAPNPQVLHLCGEHAEVGAGQCRIAVALQGQGAGPLRSILLALAEHVGLDAERRPEPRERRVGQRQLLVRRRRQRPVAVLLEEDGAGREIEGDGRRPRGGDMGDAEGTGEPDLQLRVLRRPRGGRRRGREGDQRKKGCEKTAAHAESIFRP